MGDSNDRLREARIKAGFKSARSAALRHGWVPSTYSSHENGQTAVPKDDAETYSRAFGVAPEWILYNRGGSKAARREKPAQVDLIGFVSAGRTSFAPAGKLGRVDAPDGSGPSTVAVEIRGDSLGPAFDNWLVFYDDVRRGPTDDLIGKLCVVGTEAGDILIKKLQRSKTKGLFHLVSNSGETTMTDIAVEWAAKVKHMVPR